jgi:iron complex outermembrane recepter protein
MTRSRKRKLQRLLDSKSARRMASGLPLAPLLLAGVPVAHAQDTEQGAVLEEVVVTAQKQTENLQAVPMSIQALGETKLEELRVTNMTDYMQFMPSVTFQTLGSGFTQVYMRGVANGSNGNHSGPTPSVGQYLDEQPITTIQGSLDIHVYDIERVEMLAGPQGTLYGAESQAGTIRTITNKPDPSKFSASYDLKGDFVSGGSQGYTAEGYTNIPINDSTAIRLVGWYEHSPGYIDNVKGTMTFPTSGITMDNYSRAKNNYNDGDTYGGRALLKIDLNDNWSITPGVMGQVANFNGINAYDPSVGDLKLTHFFKESSHDSWVQASLTVQGKIGNWDMVYAGAYLDRNDQTRSDYSDYAYWYDVCCGYGSSMVNDAGDLINPAQYIKGKDGYKMWSNELRFSSPRENRLRFTGGVFGQQAEHRIEQRYEVDDLTAYYWVTGWPDTIWLTEQTRTDKSYAVFGELYYDITDKLTATAGYRQFRTDNNLKGFFGYSGNFSSKTGEAACFNQQNYHGAPCVNLNASTNESGGTPKLNLAYKFDEDRMIYATYSKGFRPGGVNRRGGFPPYKADYLTNYEAGWKTTWADGAVRFNGAAFVEMWDNFQYAYLGENGLTNITNAGKAKIQGVEGYVDWAATNQLLLTAGATWLDPKLDQNFCQAILPWTYDDTLPPLTTCPDYLYAKKGTQLPASPTFKGNMIARYSFMVGEFDASVQGSYVYQTKVETDIVPFNRQFTGTQGAYGIADFSASLKKGPYSLTLFINNAFDEHADLFKYQECAVLVCAAAGAYSNPSGYPLGDPVYPGYSLPHAYTTYTGTNQPRTIGLVFRQEF